MSCEIYGCVHGPDRLQRIQKSYPDLNRGKLTSSYSTCWLQCLQSRCSELPVWEIYPLICKFCTAFYQHIEKKSASPQRKNMKFNFFSLWVVGSSVSDIHFSCEDPSSFISPPSSSFFQYFLPKPHEAFYELYNKTLFFHAQNNQYLLSWLWLSEVCLSARILDKWEKKYFM